MSEIDKQDEVVNVSLPRRDYETLRELIETRQALSGFKKFLQTSVLWVAGAVLTVFGVIEILKRY